MKRASTALVLSASMLGLLLVGCSSESAQLTEVRSYGEKVAPIAESFGKEGEAFGAAMSTGGAPDMAAVGSIRGSLQTTVDTLSAMSITDPELKAAHGHLVDAFQNLLDGVNQLTDAMKNPASVPPDFEDQIMTKMNAAEAGVEQWRQGLAAMLPEDEREDFLKE